MCCIYFLIYRFEVLGFIKNSGATLNKESARRTVVIVVVVGGGGGGSVVIQEILSLLKKRYKL